MIDRAARDRLAENGRRLASGALSTGRFESWLPFDSNDAAVEEIWLALNALYSDVWPPWSHRLRGRRRLDPRTRTAVARCVLFLHSDLEFDAAAESFDSALWPFASREDFAAATRRRRLLARR